MAALGSCSPRIYRPPALGAEYQFDRGLPAAKKSSSLFGKKAEKALSRQGVLHGNTNRAHHAAQKGSNGIKTPSGSKAPTMPRSAQPIATDSLQQRPDAADHPDTAIATPDPFWQTKAPAAEKTK